MLASNVTEPGGGSAHEEETVRFPGARLGVQLNTDYGVGEEQQLLAALRRTKGPALICWEHHTSLPASRAASAPSPPLRRRPGLSDRFDVVWVLVPTATRQEYRFYQVPELLLPGDSEALVG